MEGSRPAGPGDDALLGALLDAARAESASRRGGSELLADRALGSAAGEDVVRTWRQDAQRLVLAGTIDGAVVGVGAGRLAAVATSGTSGTSGRTGVVDCCYVDPEARGVGVGTALAGALVAWFAERGCDRTDVYALPGDRATKQLFERLGFSARLLVLHRRLP